MIAVAHVEEREPCRIRHVEEHRTQLFELMDVVAVRLRHALGLSTPSFEP